MFSLEQYDALQTRAGLLDRSARGRLHLTGADRRAYLHGLLTNDIAALRSGDGCYAALLTPQGRMISDMRVSEIGERTLIDLPARTADTVRDHLATFIFSEDAEVHDVRAAQSQLGLYGPLASACLARVATRADSNDDPAPPREQLEVMALNANATWRFGNEPLVVVRSDDYGVAGFELFVETSRADDLAQALGAAGAENITSQTADVARVEAGRPEFGVDMDEHTIPLEAGIEDRAISLTKGCYVGQEIIIRVLHRGQGRVAKRLVGLVADPQAGELQRGERIHAGEKEVGMVTSAVVSPRLRRPIALGYVLRDRAQAGQVLQLPRASGAKAVTVVTLPFVQSAAE